jgi:hypothetical protein
MSVRSRLRRLEAGRWLRATECEEASAPAGLGKIAKALKLVCTAPTGDAATSRFLWCRRSGESPRQGTNSAQAFSHSRTIAGYVLPPSSLNSTNAIESVNAMMSLDPTGTDANAGPPPLEASPAGHDTAFDGRLTTNRI